MVQTAKEVRSAMAAKPLPEFETRHRMSLALEYADKSVNEIARELGISRTTVSNYMHGRTQPRRSDLMAWALVTGVPLDWLETGKSDSASLGPDDDPEPAAPVKKRARTQANRRKAWTGEAPVRMLRAA